MRRRTALLVLAVACVAAVAVFGLASSGGSPSVQAPPGIHLGRVEMPGGIYPYAVYVPPGIRGGDRVPLVVVVHGCETTALQQVAASAYDRVADQHRFVVLYPDVNPTDVAESRCWQGIWRPSAEGRGRGDAAAIAAMTRAAITRWHLDRDRVYAIGMSSGAFETSILGAAYPDLFAAIGIHSGAAYMAGESGCMAGAAPTAQQTSALAGAAFDAMGPRARPMPVIVFHGDADSSVPYTCGQQVVAQWLGTDDLVLAHSHQSPVSATPDVSRGAVPGGHAYSVASYLGARGCPVVQLWTIHGMNHYWSGGSAAPASARWTDPRGPSAAVNSWAFFRRWRLSGPAGSCASTKP